MSSPSASGAPKRRRPVRHTYHTWTDAEREAVIAAYYASGPAGAVAAGGAVGASKSATLSMVDKHREVNGLPTYGDLRAADALDVLLEVGEATTAQLAAATGMTFVGTRSLCRRQGWTETRKRVGIRDVSVWRPS